MARYSIFHPKYLYWNSLVQILFSPFFPFLSFFSFLSFCQQNLFSNIQNYYMPIKTQRLQIKSRAQDYMKCLSG